MLVTQNYQLQKSNKVIRNRSYNMKLIKDVQRTLPDGKRIVVFVNQGYSSGEKYHKEGATICLLENGVKKAGITRTQKGVLSSIKVLRDWDKIEYNASILNLLYKKAQLQQDDGTLLIKKIMKMREQNETL